MNFLPSLLNWQSANAPTSLPKEIPYEEKKQDDGYISVMDPARPPEVESVSELLVRKINDIWQGMKDPGKVVNFLAREAIDPLNYLPSAPAKAAAVTAGSAGILAALMKFGTITPSKAVSTGNQAGAFRPSASRLLPSSLIDLSQSLHSSLGYRKTKTRDNLDSIADLILDKTITSKELTKYGAPEFQIDPFLAHVRDPEYNPTDRIASEYPLSDFLAGPITGAVLHKNAGRAYAVKEAADVPSLSPYLKQGDAMMMSLLNTYPSLENDARAFMGQLKDKKLIFSLYPESAKNDIIDGVEEIARILDMAGHGPEQLSKKTLQQLVGLAQKEERDLLEKQAKSLQTLTEHTTRRTIELQTKQKLPPESKGLVQLENEKDLATETAFQNICCGAGRVDQNTMRYVPAWDPITGKREPGLGTVPVSGDNFFGRIKSGESLMFSYRPNGIPEATIELNAKNGSIREIAGKNNDPMDPKLKDVVLKALAPIQNKLTATSAGIRLTGDPKRDAAIKAYVGLDRDNPNEYDIYMRLARDVANGRMEVSDF